jgi:hypothetical protein
MNNPMPIAEKPDGVKPPEAVATVAPIGSEQLKDFTQILQKYKAGKSQTEQRIISSESWWKLRNTVEEQKETEIGKDGGFTSKSGWLHNVIVSKHADAMEAYPEPNILPREEGDRGEARMLTAIVPCVLEQNHFEETYDDAMWRKMKGGTGSYKVIWDKNKLYGLGDISIECANLLNLFWEPGVTNIQKSRYFFHTELCDKDLLIERYPQLEGKLKGETFISSKFLYDDSVDTENKVTIIEAYYHKYIQGKNTLQYVKYVGDTVLYATENDTQRPTAQASNANGQPLFDMMGQPVMVETGPSMAERGLYDHGKYPYVFDPLFPIEGSPCGYGFVDICRNPQTEIDVLKTCFMKNARVGAVPRYFSRGDGSVNEEEFLDLSKPIVHAPNGVDENALRRIEHNSLDGNYINVLDRTIQELRETSGNTETSTGNTSSGVTAASAIAALQEASGKGSRDSTQASYRAYSEIVEMCIELIRQFYDMPRKFRIMGEYGSEQYVTYTNAGIKAQHQGFDFGQDMGYRLPIFDIKVSAQKKNVYTKVSQNELALQFFQLGFFDPQMTDQTLMCLDLMEFDGRDGIMQKVAQNGTMFQKLLQYMEMALMFSQTAAPELTEQIAQDFMMTTGGAGVPSMGGASPKLMESDNIAGVPKKEHSIVANARARSQNASQPHGGEVAREKKK